MKTSPLSTGLLSNLIKGQYHMVLPFFLMISCTVSGQWHYMQSTVDGMIDLRTGSCKEKFSAPSSGVYLDTLLNRYILCSGAQYKKLEIVDPAIPDRWKIVDYRWRENIGTTTALEVPFTDLDHVHVPVPGNKEEHYCIISIKNNEYNGYQTYRRIRLDTTTSVKLPDGRYWYDKIYNNPVVYLDERREMSRGVSYYSICPCSVRNLKNISGQ